MHAGAHGDRFHRFAVFDLDTMRDEQEEKERKRARTKPNKVNSRTDNRKENRIKMYENEMNVGEVKRRREKKIQTIMPHYVGGDTNVGGSFFGQTNAEPN